MDTGKFQRVNEVLAGRLYKDYPDQWKRVMSQEMCDIDGSFLGFVMIYKNLAELIPKDWTILDFGCAYAPQAYYFREHKKYIGIDSGVRERFAFENTEHVSMTIKEWMAKQPVAKDREKEFAICSFVPAFEEIALVRQYYPDLFVYYPIRDNYPDRSIQKDEQ